MDIRKYIIDNKLNIIVKPNSPKTKLISYDENKKALRVAVAAVPDKGKANKEIIKFFSKLLKKKVGIIKGKKSKNKVISLP